MYIISKFNKSVNQKGSSLLLPVSGWVGQGRLKDIMPSRQKNLMAKPKQAGKNWGSLRGERFRFPATAGTQNRKIFFSLIKKNKKLRAKKINVENFSILLRISVAETLARAKRGQIKSNFSVRILLVKSSNFFQ